MIKKVLVAIFVGAIGSLLYILITDEMSILGIIFGALISSPWAALAVYWIDGVKK